MNAEDLVRDTKGKLATAEDLCLKISDPDHLALTETFRICRGYATDVTADKAFANLESVLHARTLPFKASLLNDVTILGSGHVLVCRNHIVAESRSVSAKSLTDCIRRSLSGEVRSLQAGTTWILCGNVLDENNHWHWLAQHLPAILQALVLSDSLGIGNIGLVTQPLSLAQIRSLELLGLDRVPRVEITEAQSCLAPSAIFSTIQSSVGWTRASAFRKSIGDALRSAASRGGIQTAPLLYASRSDTKKRPMLNEPELERRLSALGFRIIRCGDHSLDEQIALFSNAELVVGPHGAALTNAIFARPSAAIYELQQVSYPNATMASMSRIAGCSHWVDHFPDEGRAGNAEGWRCDVEAVVRNIEVILRRNPWSLVCNEARRGATPPA